MQNCFSHLEMCEGRGFVRTSDNYGREWRTGALMYYSGSKEGLWDIIENCGREGELWEEKR